VAEYEVRIGTPLEGVLIQVLKRQFPDSMDWEDGNWLDSPIDIDLGRFRGSLPAQLRVDELQAFRVALESVSRTLTGEATLESMNGWLKLSMKCEPTGGLTVAGIADDSPGIGNKLRFTIGGMDQSFLPEIIDQLRSIEDAFPLRGRY
jgi:hypothetical protein